MFGFSIVRKQTIKDLNWQLKNALEDGYAKDKKIDELQLKVKELEDKINSLSAPAKGVNLITDVAEAPLTVEKKVDIKKSGSTIRKKVVHKSEE
jgi:hypothetical protein